MRTTTYGHSIVRRTLITLAAMAASLLMVLTTVALPAQAQSTPSGTTITVNTDVDEDITNGDCSLREAIKAANTNEAVDACPAGSSSGEDAIGFNLPSLDTTITLDSTLPVIVGTAGLVIDGGEGAGVTVSGGGASRVFQIGSNAEVAMERLTISDGFLSGNFPGAGIDNLGTLTLTNSTVSGNEATDAGGIINEGDLTLMSSTVSGNHADRFAGGIANDGNLTLMNSTVSGNEAGSFAAGIYNVDDADSTITIKNSTISGNSTLEGIGGAIYSGGGPVVIENSTITENSDSDSNGMGGGVISAGSVEVGSSIISGNANSDVVYYTGTTNGYNSNGYNLIGSGNAASAFGAAGDQTGILDPVLDPLADNGGSTFTHMPLGGSPAIDKGKASPGLPTDQRGEARPVDHSWLANAAGGDGSDIGAVEVHELPKLAMSGVTVIEGDSGTTEALFEVRLPSPATHSITVDYTTEDDTAVAPGDYVETSGTLTFFRGQTVKTVAVPVEGDVLDEFAEGFFLNLSNPQGATIGGGSAAATIRDDDPTPSVSVNDLTVTEAATGRTTATFAVSLSSESGKAVIVDYSTADGTAVAPDDYVETSGTAYFRPGVTERNITVPVKADIYGEPTENFLMRLLGAENATVADGEGEATIVDPRPDIVLVRPADGASGVSVTADVQATFSKEMDPSSVNSSTFELREEGSSEALSAAVHYDTDYRRAALDPSAKLLPGTSYVATIKGGPDGVKDTSGKELEAEKTWSFTVAADKSAPNVVKVSPNQGATGIAPGRNVAAVFSEAMDPTTLTKATFKLYEKGSTTALKATVSYDAATRRATLDPRANLERGTTYKAVVTSGAKDLAGNSLDQNPNVTGNQMKVWSFTISP